MQLQHAASALLLIAIAGSEAHASDDQSSFEQQVDAHEYGGYGGEYVQVVKDLRLSLGAEEAPLHVTVSNGAESDTAASGRRLGADGSLMFVFGRLHEDGGIIIGTGLVVDRGRTSLSIPGGSVELSYERYQARFACGYGYAFSERMHVEITPYISAGFGSASFPGVYSFYGINNSQVVGSVGILAGFYLRLSQMRCGVQVGYDDSDAVGSAVSLHGGSLLIDGSFGIVF
jgi:hypothetical protein